MKQKIIIKIEYSHSMDCKYNETHDSWDCDCGAHAKENKEEVISDQTL